MNLRLQSVEFATGDLDGFLLLETVLFFLRAQGLIALALRPGAQAGESLWALVTRRSVHALGLAPGQRVVASFKAVAVEGRSVAQFTEAEPDAG